MISQEKKRIDAAKDNSSDEDEMEEMKNEYLKASSLIQSSINNEDNDSIDSAEFVDANDKLTGNITDAAQIIAEKADDDGGKSSPAQDVIEKKDEPEIVDEVMPSANDANDGETQPLVVDKHQDSAQIDQNQPAASIDDEVKDAKDDEVKDDKDEQ